jgi:hypothetical protein
MLGIEKDCAHCKVFRIYGPADGGDGVKSHPCMAA